MPTSSSAKAVARPPVAIDIEQLVAELYAATCQAGMQADDPLMPLVRSLVQTIRYLDQRTTESDRIAHHSARRIVNAVSTGRELAAAEEERIRASLAKTEADTISRIANAIVETADAALSRRAKTLDRSFILRAIGALFSVGAICLIGGATWGRAQAYTTFHETESELQAAFRDGPDAAHSWRLLMAWNDLRHELRTCGSVPGRIHFQDGRRWCDVPLWVESPTNPLQ